MADTEHERQKFESWIVSPPFEYDVDRFSTDATKSPWPGNYQDIAVQLAWCAWQEAIDNHEATNP